MAAEESAGGVRSVARALEILSLLGDKPSGMTLREAVTATGLPKTTVLRLLQTLEQHGLLWNLGSQTYVPGPALLHLADVSADAWRLRPDLAQMLEDLAQQCHETVNLWVRRGLTRVCVAQAQAHRSLRHVIRVGDQLPLDSGASSKVLLTDVPDDVLVDVVAAGGRDPDHVETLRQWAADARAQGWALSHGEREEGLSALAVPIRSAGGAAAATLTLSGPTVRFTPERCEQFLKGLRGCADEIGRRGFGPSKWRSA
jgi:DNA-binding IclR family transcriptional regulator